MEPKRRRFPEHLSLVWGEKAKHGRSPVDRKATQVHPEPVSVLGSDLPDGEAVEQEASARRAGRFPLPFLPSLPRAVLDPQPPAQRRRAPGCASGSQPLLPTPALLSLKAEWGGWD